MWPMHAIVALDLARERARSAQEQARREALVRASAPVRTSGPLPPRRPPNVRALTARAVRRVAATAHGLERRANLAAARIERGAV